MSDDEMAARTYVLEETVLTKTKTLEELAELAARGIPESEACEDRTGRNKNDIDSLLRLR